MKLNRYHFGILIIILASFITSVIAYSYLPEMTASHWGINGEVNGYMPRFWGAFIMPIISIFIFLMFVILPRIDPKKENIKEFRVYFDRFILILFLFLFYLHLLTLFWNIGYRFNMMQFLSIAFVPFFYYTGDLIQHSKQNWFIGIRTPWTLSNEMVWRKTHEMGGRLFKLMSVFEIAGIFLPYLFLPIMVIFLVVIVIFSIFYSYLEYSKLKN